MCNASDGIEVAVRTQSAMVLDIICGYPWMIAMCDAVDIGSEQPVGRDKMEEGEDESEYSLFGRVVELILSRSLETLLHTGILPEGVNGIPDFGWQAVSFDLCGLHEDGLYMVFCPLVIKW